jgi:hypothetical protein
MGAIKGQVLDADGSAVLLDIYTAFGVCQIVQSMELDVAGTKVRQLALEAKRKVEKVIGSSAMITGFLALCGEGFFDAFISHQDVEAAYARGARGQCSDSRFPPDVASQRRQPSTVGGGENTSIRYAPPGAGGTGP